MKKIAVIAAMLMVLIAPLETKAQYFNGNQIMDTIRKKDSSSFSDGVLTGYVAAVYDAMSAEDKKRLEICVPSRVTLGQLMEVFAKFMKQNPEVWDKNASALVTVALMQSFPCPK